MSEQGLISFAPTESDYMNPWIATRVATVWFERELLAADGDMDLAIRAYHRGQAAAFDEKGDAYLARVHSLRGRYIHAQTASPTWRLLTQEVARRRRLDASLPLTLPRPDRVSIPSTPASDPRLS